jgi:cell division protein FtsN
MTKLSSKQALTLYGLVVTFVFVAFVLGLLIGTGSVERVAVQPANSSYEPVEDLDAPLDFYEELSKPVEESKSNLPVVVLERGSKAPPEPTATEESEETLAAAEKGADQVTIQVAAYSTREEADQLLLRLETKGFTGRIREPKTDNGNTYYRVWVGQFSSMTEAEGTAMRLKEEGFHTYIRRTR